MILLSPGRCDGCRARLVYGTNRQGLGAAWRDARTYRVHECAGIRSDEVWTHGPQRCGAWMKNAREDCARWPGHRGEHRTRYALDNASYAALARRAAA